MSLNVTRFRSEEAEVAACVLSQLANRSAPRERLKAFLAVDSHYFLAASIAGAWAGFAYAYELARPDGEVMLFLYGIDVSPEYRRRGVATAMLSYLRRMVRERKLKELFVLADRDNETAVAFYTATGGVAEGRASLCFVYPGYDSSIAA